MKKRLYIIIIICMVACFALTGCQSKETKEQENINLVIEEETNIAGNSTSQTNNATNTINSESNTKTANEELKPTEVKKQYDEDLPMGVEIYHVTVNGNDVAVNVQTTGSSQQQKDGPYYIYYNIHVGYDEYHNKFKLVKEGIYHLEGYGIEMLKTFDIEEDVGVNYEFFEGDLTTSAYKGIDKEYVAISLPAGTEDKNQATLLLATDEGDLVGEFTADIVNDITLTGTDAEKYKNRSGSIVFNSIKDGKVTYLAPTDKMYKTDSNGKKVLDTSLDVIELDEYAVSITNDKATSQKTGDIYKITNANGKVFGFGEFRY